MAGCQAFPVYRGKSSTHTGDCIDCQIVSPESCKCPCFSMLYSGSITLYHHHHPPPTTHHPPPATTPPRHHTTTPPHHHTTSTSTTTTTTQQQHHHHHDHHHHHFFCFLAEIPCQGAGFICARPGLRWTRRARSWNGLPRWRILAGQIR